MTGRVTNLHPFLPVIFRLPEQPDFTLEFVVDTGFTGFLTLPSQAVAAMKLPFLHRISADLADSSAIELDVFDATVIWNGAEKHVPLLAMGHRPLLGTAFLKSTELVIHFVEGGTVVVRSL